MRNRRIGKLACVVAAAGLLWAQPAAAQQAVGAARVRETKAQRDKRMAWWREARFGMFIHWGLYAIPAGVWKGKRISGIGEWIMNRARIPVSEYEKLVPQFNPVKFNAKQWVALAKDAGMKYIVITSKHHDGFCLWDSKVSDYDIMATPFKRDLLKELSDECHKQGIRMCFYHSIMDWHHPQAKGKDFAKYREQYLKPQLRELVKSYGPLGILWFDGEWIREWTDEQGWDLYRFVRALQPDIIINNRVGKSRKGMQGMSGDARSPGDYGTPEQRIPPTGMPGLDWETCMTMNNTWGFKTHDHNWKPTQDLLRKLVDIASKGGNFLLNVGPTAEGLIPEPSVERLREMGTWLKVNGESVYGTGPSVFKRLPWGRCTTEPGKLYLHVFQWPADGKLLAPGLTARVEKAYLLADPKHAALKASQTDTGVVIDVPAKAPDPIVSVVVLSVAGKVEVAARTIGANADGSYTLKAVEAETHGGGIRYEGNKDCIGYWLNAKDWVSWGFKVARAGTFRVEITYACEKGSGESTYEVAVGDHKLAGKVTETGTWVKFVTKPLGTIKLAAAGPATLTVKATHKPNLAVMNLRAIRLVPEKD
jgi:alpha-L-fucosidase